MAETEATDLDLLPGLAHQMLSTLGEVGDSLSAAAIRHALERGGRTRAAPRLTQGGLNWRLRITKQGERVFFFFVRRKRPPVPVVDAEVRFDLTPIPFDELPGTNRDGNIGLQYQPPPFVMADPTDEIVDRYTGDDDATPDNTALLLGEETGEVLAVVHPDRGVDGFGSHARLYHTVPGSPPVRLGQGTVPWPLPPFRSVIRRLADWVREDDSRTLARSLEIEDQGSDVARILSRLVEAYQAARKPTGPEPLQNLSEDLRSAFAVASYVTTALEADVELRLDESGNLADEFGKDTFQLRMQVGIRDLGDRTQARVRVRVPDFLVSGNIAHLLLEALRGEEALEDIRNGFRETPLGRRMEDESRRIEIEDVKDFLEGSETTSMVFRTKRKAKHHNEREDTDILAIRQPLGKFDAREELLAIVRAKFTLERQEVEDDSTVKKVESIKVLHFGSLDGAEGTLDKDDVKYFVRLAAELHRWQKVLA